LYLAKEMAISAFFQEFLKFFIQENSKFMRSDGELQYAQNDTKCSSLACTQRENSSLKQRSL
jgi:hypothetical protein